jgi:HEAT repeat protein
MMSHPDHGGPEAERSPFSATLARVLKHIWPIFDAEAPGIGRELETLRVLTPAERMVALVVRGPAASHGWEATRDHALLRLDTLSEGADILAPVAASSLGRGGDLGYEVVAEFARRILRGHPRERRIAAAALVLAPALPLGVFDAEMVAAFDDPDVAGCVGLALGQSVVRGHLGAFHTATGLFAMPSERVHPALLVGFVKGLGAGLLDAGLMRFAQLVLGEPPPRESGARAFHRAIVKTAHGIGLEAVLIDTLGKLLFQVFAGTPPEVLDTALDQHPSAVVERWLEAAATTWQGLPPEVRLVLWRRFGSRTLDDPRFVRTGADERRPEIISHILDLEAESNAHLPESIIRAWAHVSDRVVRTRLARRTPQPTDDRGRWEGKGGELVALPPRVLARDELDRLRVAILELESETVVERAARVPLDRRVEARAALVGCLDIPDAALRRAAIEALGRIGGLADVPHMLDAARRHRALEGTVAAALRALHARSASEPLAEIFARRLKWADDEAVDDWWDLGGEGNAAHLLSGLGVRYYPLARAGAARALGRHRAQEVVFALRMASLSDPHDGARAAALQALGELAGTTPGAGETAGYGILVRPGDELARAVERAQEVGSAALPGLRRTMVKGSWRRRRAACEALSGIEGDSATALLIDTLSDIDEDVRMGAAEALLQRGWVPDTARDRTMLALATRTLERIVVTPQDVDRATLFDAVELGGHVFRHEVLAAIGVLGFDDTATMTPGEKLQFHAARHEFARILSEDGGYETILLLIDNTWQHEPHRAVMMSRLHAVPSACWLPYFEHERFGWRVRQAVAEAVAFRVDDATVALLRIFVSDDEDDVRRTALRSLVHAGQARLAAGLPIQPIGDAFALALTSPFPDDREQAAAAAGTLGPALLDVLRNWMAEPWWEMRHAAAMALAAWSEAVDVAADHLLVLACDSEFKVAEAARDALDRIGRLPSVAARCVAVQSATAPSLVGLEPWFGVTDDGAAPPDLAHTIDALIDATPDDKLPQRVGLIAILSVEHLAGWLEDSALGRTTHHIGVRLAASAALRRLIRQECQVCGDARTLQCPACDGAGELPCQSCDGTGRASTPCPDPDCSASQATRRIDSPRCPTCHGRRAVSVVCACQSSKRPGRQPCPLCLGERRIRCLACASQDP